MKDGRTNNGGARKGSGGKGYGELQFIRTNASKYLPEWWKVVTDHLMNPKDKDLHITAIRELNKIQVKMIPQDITSGGDKLGLVLPAEAIDKYEINQ